MSKHHIDAPDAPDRAAQFNLMCADFERREGKAALTAILRDKAGVSHKADVPRGRRAPVMAAIIKADGIKSRDLTKTRRAVNRWSRTTANVWNRFTASASATTRGRTNEHDGG